MSLEKAILQEHLIADTVDAQFCSDWLKEEIKRLFVAHSICRQDRDEAWVDLAIIQEELKVATLALQKIYDPKKYHHDEPDDYTRLACAQFIAQEALKELGVLNALGSEVKAGEQTTQGDAPPPSDHDAGLG